MVADLRAKFIQEGIVTLPGFLKQCAIPDIIKVRRIEFYILDTVHCRIYSIITVTSFVQVDIIYFRKSRKRKI